VEFFARRFAGVFVGRWRRVVQHAHGRLDATIRRRTVAGFGAATDPIFPNATGAPMDDHNYRRRVFKPAAKRAGVPWATPHKLRHGMASLMAEQGYGAADIAAMLGHADGGVLALKTYIHPKVRAVDFVDDVLAGRADTNADTTRPAHG
jgi:integrase